MPEVWLILAETRTVERHTGLADGTYREVARAAFPATLPSTVFPTLTLPPEGIFPSDDAA